MKVKKEIEKYKNEIACFIYEPLLQGAGGMRMYDAKNLDALLSFIKKENIICIADEVLTGFYRTGSFLPEIIYKKSRYYLPEQSTHRRNHGNGNNSLHPKYI